MPFASAEGASLYYEETGKGTAIVFAHEYASDCRGWESQVRYFSRAHRCIAFNARGYPPSDVPADDSLYGQEFAAEDIGAVADHLGLDSFFVVGLSMGAAAALHYAMRHPQRVKGLVFASGGSGSDPHLRDRFVRESSEMAEMLTSQGIVPLVEGLSYGATRVQLLDKDPRGWAEFRQHLSEHSVPGSALTVRNYQGKRPSIQGFEAQLRELAVPTLIVVGDEDDPVIETSLFLKRVLPAAGLWMAPKTGHAVNLEEPAAFNLSLERFFDAVELGRWGRRNPLASPTRSAMVPTK